MSDPHFNIFHAYRGPTGSEEAALRQLEDNLTRALAITLHALRDSPTRLPLLDALRIDAAERERPYQCTLQVSKPNPDWPEPARRRLVVLHGGPQLQVMDTTSSAIKGRADAVLATRRSLLVIESKLENRVGRGQLDRHREALEIAGGDVVDVTWSELARTIRAIPIDRRAHAVPHFVLDQFEEYLRMNGFGGLTHEHFAYFAFPSDQRDPLVKDGMRRALEEIGEKVIKLTATHWHKRMLNIQASAPNAGVVIEPGEPARDPHLTISIDSAGLNVHSNVENEPSYRRFRRFWAANPAGLLSLLQRLGEQPIAGADDVPWRLRVDRRVSLGRPRAYHYYRAVDIALNMMSTWGDPEAQRFVDEVTQKPAEEGAPEILIVKSYSVPQVLAIEQLPDRLARDIEQIEAFFDWIGEPFRHR